MGKFKKEMKICPEQGKELRVESSANPGPCDESTRKNEGKSDVEKEDYRSLKESPLPGRRRGWQSRMQQPEET
ncbi:hypothetical protein AVEN_25140-1 [Araneus ventricosus]|uniref:Uncharacterized protein n=1 Tax=Araneus ventricosus TaxID=182803 RepID=A0A4Y2UA73_ARAVE|nr:hypothetical protein AVEN_25140-1 [Araneus ventricosus]